MFFLLENVTSSAQAIGNAYSSALIEYPIVTKGCTGFTLCGMGDIIAQIRGYQAMKDTAAGGTTTSSSSNDSSPSQSSFKIDYLRLARFATKGIVGTLIWSTWYDLSDNVYNDENISRILSGLGVNLDMDATSSSSSSSSSSVQKTNIFRIIMLMITEQFIACPIIYGLWEIPVATIFNGGLTYASVSKIPYELKDKLRPMLIDNFKIWTPANIFIYSTPVEYRALMANFGDILWQSIVSDFAANCGAVVESKDDTSRCADETKERSGMPRDDENGRVNNREETRDMVDVGEDFDICPAKNVTETEVLV